MLRDEVAESFSVDVREIVYCGWLSILELSPHIAVTTSGVLFWST